MIEIKAVSPIDAIIVRVDAARMAGGDYVEEAKKQLHATTDLQVAEVLQFLKHFNWDDKLISIVFATYAVPEDDALNILETKRFAHTLCENAGEAFCQNESFLVTLIVRVYEFNTHRARLLAKRFQDYISENGAFCLLRNINMDPNISAILNEKLQVAA